MRQLEYIVKVNVPDKLVQTPAELKSIKKKIKDSIRVDIAGTHIEIPCVVDGVDCFYYKWLNPPTVCNK